MRAMKTTAISCGMLNVPVKLYKAVDNHDIAFKQHHAGCGGGIAMERKCRECAEPVAYADIVKGIDHGGTLVIVSADELRDLEDEAPDAVEVEQFVGADEIDPLTYEDSYYLEPGKAAAEGYALLRQALAETGKHGLVRFAMRGKLHLGVLRVSGDLLVIHTIAWPDEVRKPSFPALDKPVALKPAVVEMAKQLVEAMTEPFEPAAWRDTYTDRLGEFIAAKADGGEFISAKPEPEDETIKDLLAALEASVAKRKAAKGAA